MSKNWPELEEFRGIDLNDSFVLKWRQQDGNLEFEIEASVWPESEYYSKPKPGEYTCYRKATLAFVDVEEIKGLRSIDKVRGTIDPDGSIDYGNFDSLLKTNEGYQLEGDFGAVRIIGGNIDFKIHT